MKVLVTGATGFIGSAIVRHLLSAGYEVRILARTKRNRRLLDGLDVEVFVGNVMSPAAVAAAVKACSVVIDAASVYTFYPFWEKQPRAMYRINVQGTRNMLNAALQNRVDRFIYTSTIATIGQNRDGEPSTEDTPFDRKSASHYAQSKFLAEREVLDACSKGLNAVILNPAIVIGQRDAKPTPSGEIIVKFLNRSYPGYFDTTWSVADVDDVARAHVAAISKGRAGERYILCNKRHYTMEGLLQALEKVSSVKAPGARIPFWLLSVFIYAEEFLAYKVFKRKPLLPTEGVKFCRNSALYDNSKAVRELGYEETPFDDTLRKAVRWYRRHGYVASRGIFRLKAYGSATVKRVMQGLKMDRYTDRLSLDNFIFYSTIKLLEALKAAGVQPKEDGWRRTTRVYLCSEASKFVLACMRLDVWSDHPEKKGKTWNDARVHIVRRVARFLKDQPQTHWQLEYQAFSARRVKKAESDVVQAEFDGRGNLKSLTPYFDSSGDSDFEDGFSPDMQNRVLCRIIKCYNETIDVPDIRRPKVLKKMLRMYLLEELRDFDRPIRRQARIFVDRVLSATFIHFEELTSVQGSFDEQRFQTPDFIKRKHPGFGFLNILCRVAPDLIEADLWFQFSHVPADGVPMQEILKDLKRSWGQTGTVKLPKMKNKDAAVDKPLLCSSNGDAKGVYHLNAFIDFSPFLKYRKQLIARYEGKLKSNITVAALLMWEAAHYPAFEGMKFAVPVDLPRTDQRERTLGFAFIRPGLFFNWRKPDGGLLDFQREFDRQLRATRKRQSIGYQLLEAYALTPPFMYRCALKLLPSALQDFGGSIGITIIKDAELFISPYTDVHTDGFIAISNFRYRREDGGKVCNVSIKGPKHKLDHYMEAIKDVAGLDGSR